MPKPKIQLNWEIVEKRMEAGCTAKEISMSMRIHRDTFTHKVRERYGRCFADIASEFYSAGDSNLKFTQYMKALSGNIPMLMLLGRERLGQGKEKEKDADTEKLARAVALIDYLQSKSDLKMAESNSINADKSELDAG